MRSDDQSVIPDVDMAQAARELGVPGVAVGVLQDGAVETACHGVSSVGRGGHAVDESTLFQIGSTAKTLTATAVMVLVEQGRVALDRHVREYLPELRLRDDPAAGPALTPGHLLNHTAGWDGDDSWTDTGEGDDALERAAALLADLPRRFAPGSDASYDNAAFVLAGRLVERVTGETFERALSRLVLDPLGLRQTHTSLNEIMARPFAVGHRAEGSGDHGAGDPAVSVVRPWSDPRGYLPAGARIASSLRDQLAWERFQLGDGRTADGTRLLSEHRLRAMHAPSTPHEVLPGTGTGIGWLLREIDGVRLVEHHGDVAGQHSTVTVVPERGFAAVVLANSGPPGRELADRLVRSALVSRLGLVERPPETLRLTRDELAPYTGHFRTDGIELRIAPSGSRDGGLTIHGTIVDGEDGPGESLEFPVDLLPGERFLVVDGPFSGLQGEFVREDAGAGAGAGPGEVVAVRHVGRLVPRAGEAS